MKTGIDIDIRKHGFYLILAAVLLLYVAIYFLLSPDARTILKNFNNMSESKIAIQERLDNAPNLPNSFIIDYHKKQGDTLRKMIEEIRKTLQKRDSELEQWFKDIPENSLNPETKSPFKEKFFAVYSTERNKLIEYYASRTEGMKIARPVKEMSLTSLDESSAAIDIKNRMRDIERILPLKYNELREVVLPDQMKNAQKDFWLIKNLLEVFEDGKLKRIYQYNFKNEWPAVINPNEIFFRRLIEITGQIEYGDLNFLLEEVLNNKYVVTEIRKISIKRDNSYRPETISLEVPWKKTPEEVLKEYFRNNPSKSRLPLVEITLEFFVLDYQDNL